MSKLVQRRQIIDEVMNDTLMVVWDKADTFNGDSNLSTWIFSIAYRKAIKAVRKQDEPVEDPWAEHRISLDPSPEDELGRQKAQVLLYRAIDERSVDRRAVVEFTYFHEMGYREIADTIGGPLDLLFGAHLGALQFVRSSDGQGAAQYDWRVTVCRQIKVIDLQVGISDGVPSPDDYDFKPHTRTALILGASVAF